MAEAAGVDEVAEHPVPLQERVKFLAAVQEVARQDVAQCVSRFGLSHLVGKSPGFMACRPPQPLVVDAYATPGARPVRRTQSTRPAAAGIGRAPGPRPQSSAQMDKGAKVQTKRDPKLAAALLRQQRTATEDMKSDFSALRREVAALAGALQQTKTGKAEEDADVARARKKARRQARAERQAEEAHRAREAVRQAVRSATHEDHAILSQSMALAGSQQTQQAQQAQQAVGQQADMPSPPASQRSMQRQRSMRNTATSPVASRCRSEGTSPHFPAPAVHSVGVGVSPRLNTGGPSFDAPARSHLTVASSFDGRSPRNQRPTLRHCSTSPLLPTKFSCAQTSPLKTSPLLRACDEPDPIPTPKPRASPARLEEDDESETTDSSLYLPPPGAGGFADVMAFNSAVDSMLGKIQEWDTEAEAAFRSNEAVLRLTAESAARLARDNGDRSPLRECAQEAPPSAPPPAPPGPPGLAFFLAPPTETHEAAEPPPAAPPAPVQSIENAPAEPPRVDEARPAAGKRRRLPPAVIDRIHEGKNLFTLFSTQPARGRLPVDIADTLAGQMCDTLLKELLAEYDSVIEEVVAGALANEVKPRPAGS